MSNITEHLRMMAKAKAHMKLHNFEQWLLDNGEEFGPIVDAGVPLGQPKLCYMNAANAVTGFNVDPQWRYTEGVVLLEKLPFLPIEHAWLSNAKGEVLELTSQSAREDGASYWGVPYETRFLRRQLVERGYYGLHLNHVRYSEITEQPLPEEARAWSRNARQEAA